MEKMDSFWYLGHIVEQISICKYSVTSKPTNVYDTDHTYFFKTMVDCKAFIDMKFKG